jgi:hypothetical protein
VLATVRPDAWNFPLFLHVLGAMALVGVLLIGVFSFAAARAGVPGSHRFGFRTLLIAGLPSYIVMRVGAQLIADKEGFKGEDDPAWIGIGYIVTDVGALLLIIALVCTGIASRRAGRGENPRGLATAGVWLTGVLLAAYVVAIWAMTTKPD